MTKSLLLLAMILVLPTLSFGQTVCGIAPGSPVSLSEGGSETLQLTCPGVTFSNLGPNGFNTFVMYEDGTTQVSDVVFASNLGGVATVSFQSDAVETGTGGVDTPSSIILTTTGGETLTFTSDDDSSTGPSDFVSAATPEPATFATFGTGLLLLGGFLRRKLRTENRPGGSSTTPS